MEYETVLLIDGLLEDSNIESEIVKTEELIKSKGELKNVTRLGKRRLAYAIKKKSHGYYAVFNYTGNGKLVDEMEQGFRYNERVLRYLTIRN